MDFSGKAVIVTGSSSGIGAALARRLAGLGAGVVVNSASSAEAGRQLAAELADAVYVQGDIGDPATGTALVTAAQERWGRLDGLVNNAGRTTDVPLPDFASLTVERWERVLRTNVIGTFLVTQAALPALQEAEDGWVVNVTSVAGIRSLGSSLPYAASKAAVNHLTTIMARYATGVRVNAVAPGLVDTPWTASWDVQKKFVEGLAPAKRVASPEDIVEACLALATNTYITGHIMVVDGGLSLAT